MTRRFALQLMSGAAAVATRKGDWSVATVGQRPTGPLPVVLRPGWSCFPVRPGPDGRVTLRWQQGVAGPARLRLTVAFDARENARLLVRESSRGDVLGEFDIRFAYPFQPFDLELTERQAEAAAEQGVTLELVEGFGPLWFFSGAPSEVGGSLLPHLRRNVYPSESCFTEAIRSLAAAQPFGWMEGCVMDGLHQRARLLRSQTDRIALERHIQAYFDHRDTPRYVPHTDAPVRHGSEGLLPFAVLAQYDRSHPSFQGMLEFCQTAAVSGVIRDGQVTTAEGCYTLAYPLAVLGVVRDDHRLRDLAVGQLLHRIERLVGRGVLYLRAADTGARTFPNWARGLAWFALGIIRTVDALPAEEVPPPVIEAFRWCAELALKWQHPTGLWSCFIDQPETGIEASGSAGIAAALTVGARLLPDPARALRAARAAHGALLSRHLVPGGFLGTVSQANRDGERLQRSGYRVIGHFGAGLLAQLDAALRVSA